MERPLGWRTQKLSKGAATDTETETETTAALGI